MSSRIVETATDIVTPFMILFGVYIIINGHLTPGGGFQGGVILGSCALLIYVVFGIKRHNKNLSIFENIGALIFLCIGVLGIFFGGFLFSNFITKGTPGNLLSGGTIPFINLAIGLKIGAGFAILFFIILQYIEKGD